TMEALPTPEPTVFSLTVADIATDHLRWVLLSQKHCKTHTQRCGRRRFYRRRHLVDAKVASAGATVGSTPFHGVD
ncbi:hypothetical protein U1Q18_012969, partial [Sarracenia purpurea var. burkii]